MHTQATAAPRQQRSSALEQDSWVLCVHLCCLTLPTVEACVAFSTAGKHKAGQQHQKEPRSHDTKTDAKLSRHTVTDQPGTMLLVVPTQ